MKHIAKNWSYHLRLPQTLRSKQPVKLGVSTERDNTPEFRRKLKLAGIHRRALDCDII